MHRGEEPGSLEEGTLRHDKVDSRGCGEGVPRSHEGDGSYRSENRLLLEGCGVWKC